MIEVKGKYNSAKIYAETLEDSAKGQIEMICNQDFLSKSKIRIMPNVHAGIGCTIGTTMTIEKIVIPNLVGVDIGCGMEVIQIGEKMIDLPQLDACIKKYVPSGLAVHESNTEKFPDLQDLYCYRALKNTKRLERSIGTLGGGNHFIEVDRDDDNNLYLVVHSGSRNLGKQVADYYQNLAIEIVVNGKETYMKERAQLISEYKALGKSDEIQNALKKLEVNFNSKVSNVPKDLAYLTDQYFEQYIHDMKICQDFAALNRKTILKTITEKLI